MSAHAKCPTCKREVATDAPAFPFCNARCKLVDLGNWLDGKYVIPGPPATEGAFFESDVDVPDDPKVPRA